MSTATDTIESLVKQEYKYGFVTDVESESTPPGLSEDTIRHISAKKNEPAWLTDWRIKAFRYWQTMPEPTWQFVKYPKIDFQDISYFSQPKPKGDAPKSLDEVDPKFLETYEKLGIPLRERGRLAGVAVDAIFDSVSVGTTYREDLGEEGNYFLLVQRGGARASRTRQKISRLGGALHGQLLCRAEFRRFHRRLVLLHPERRALSDGAFDLFPHQRREVRPV